MASQLGREWGGEMRIRALPGALMNKQDMAQMYRDYLFEEGYAPRIDNDGDVVFKFEGRTFLIIPDDGDAEFFRLAFPNFWRLESDDERKQAMLAALNVTAAIKVAKIFPVRDNMWATIELFCTPPEAFKPVFGRSLHALNSAVEQFRQSMQEPPATVN